MNWRPSGSGERYEPPGSREANTTCQGCNGSDPFGGGDVEKIFEVRDHVEELHEDASLPTLPWAKRVSLVARALPRRTHSAVGGISPSCAASPANMRACMLEKAKIVRPKCRPWWTRGSLGSLGLSDAPFGQASSGGLVVNRLTISYVGPTQGQRPAVCHFD